MKYEDESIKPDLVIDTRGLFCPVPIIKTSEALDNLDNGSILEVISDDPAIEFDLPAWCKSAGHSIKSIEKEEETFRIKIIKR